MNDDPVTSGFDQVEEFVDDIERCIGYPKMYAYVSEHEGQGFRRYCGFIQIVTMRHGDKMERHLDAAFPEGREIPFCAFGYPTELFDAPVNNFIEGDLFWEAHTYLVEMPSFLTDNEIRFLAGFSWGYEENSTGEGREVDLLPFSKLSLFHWNEDTSFLRDKMKNWKFQ